MKTLMFLFVLLSFPLAGLGETITGPGSVTDGDTMRVGAARVRDGRH